MSGTLWPFRYRGQPLYGALLALDESWPALVAERGYAPAASALLGESLCAVGLLAGLAKRPPKLTLQLSAVAGVELLVAQSLRPGQLRGLIKPVDLAAFTPGPQARLVMTLESPGRSQAQQSIVPMARDTLAAAMADYFDQSEQLPTRFYLYADAQRAFGLVVQRVAGDDTPVDAALQVVENWALRELPPQPQDYLGVLLEADIELLEPVQPWALSCHCDSGTVSRMLLGLGVEDARALLAEQGHIEIECGYCGQPYRFDAAQVEQLFAAEQAPPEAPRH